MFQYHTEMVWELNRERQAKALDEAARERALANAGITNPKLAVRRIAIALLAMAPIALVMVWVFVVR